jgi:apolipoprotein D and lipocalin family protein
MSIFRKVFILVSVMLVSACTGIPEGVSPVTGFDLNRYLGTWYEIARLDHSFERDLQQVTADYSVREDGGIRVVNRGYNTEKQAWEQAEGKAYFIGDSDVGRLKVSFFGPFYGAYNIMELDRENYQYAMISGPDRSYLWILARTPDPGQATVDRLVEQAASLGFDSEQLIFVDHAVPE